MNIFILSTTDIHLAHDSKCVLNYFTSKVKAIKFAKKDSKQNKEKLTKEQIIFLRNNNQTQGRIENYIITKQ